MTESSGELAVGMLGPLEVSIAGRPVVLTTGRLRTLLAVLAMSAGKAVPVERLASALWDGELPDNARRSVQTYLTRLRGALGASAIGSEPAGYLLRTEPERVDALRFVGLLDAATQAADPASERVLLRQALSLWRGSPFDGVPSTWLERSEAPRLLERYLATMERRIDLDLAEGRHGELVAPLYELTAQHPLRESLWVRLLVVLYRSGRQAEALERYETIRVRLADELGADPGPELRQAYADLLAGKAPQAPASAQPATPAGPVMPQQLPADVDGFAGRESALKALHNLVGAGHDRDTTAVVISAIAGTAGVGKTALAVHWAHQAADRFPDGQLYVNLRGHSAGPAVEPGDAVRSLLDALGAPPHRVPPDLDAQTGLYRSLLAGKRMLVVLDNARDAEQVRPLLPGSPTCLVVVTSRNQLTSLVATEAARPLMLDLLPVDEARELLARRLGEDRVAAETRAVDEIITSCARLPLALAIVAARAATNPTFPLHLLAAQLCEGKSNLDALTADDPATDARAVFSWSYRTLSTEAARLFRLLGQHPGPDTSVLAAASLAGHPPAQTRPLLAELTRAHLLAEHAPGRYTFHDLLRAYAAELARTHDGDADQRVALHRLVDHYLHTAHTAAVLLNPQRDPIGLRPPLPGVAAEDVADQEQALSWFATEHPALIASIERAASAGFDVHAWQLAWCTAFFLDRHGHWHDLATTQLAALAATQRLADRSSQARAHRYVAAAYSWLGRYEETNAHLRQALDIYQELGDRLGQGHTHHTLAMVFEEQGDYRAALQHAHRSLALYRRSDDSAGEARALNAVGWQHALLGEYSSALTYCEQALALHREQADPYTQAHTLDSLGYAQYHLGRHQEAVTSYQRSIELFREVGDRYYQSQVLDHLGEAHVATGEPAAARMDWRAALEILDDLDHPDAGGVRAKLARLDSLG